MIPCVQTLNFDMTPPFSQAGFGTDFSKMWDAKSLDIISPVDESENILVYITKKALMGIQFSLRAIYPPFNQVCLYN